MVAHIGSGFKFYKDAGSIYQNCTSLFFNCIFKINKCFIQQVVDTKDTIFEVGIVTLCHNIKTFKLNLMKTHTRLQIEISSPKNLHH